MLSGIKAWLYDRCAPRLFKFQQVALHRDGLGTHDLVCLVLLHVTQHSPAINMRMEVVVRDKLVLTSAATLPNAVAPDNHVANCWDWELFDLDSDYVLFFPQLLEDRARGPYASPHALDAEQVSPLAALRCQWSELPSKHRRNVPEDAHSYVDPRRRQMRSSHSSVRTLRPYVDG